MRATLVWLHGLGASANDFTDLGHSLQCPGLRIVALEAPPQSVSIFGGQVAPSWFDIREDAAGEVVSDLDGLEASARRVRAEWTRQREAGIDRLAVGGYSQGGAQALFTALTEPEDLFATVGLSCYLPQHLHLDQEAARLNFRAPTFLGHGTRDEVVRHEYGEYSRDWLREHGAQVEWFSDDFEHTVTPEELAAMGAFLRGCLDG